jgi:hypothetical protein
LVCESVTPFPFFSLDIVSLQIIALLFAGHVDRIKAFFAEAKRLNAIVILSEKWLRNGDGTKMSSFNPASSERDECCRIMPAIK